MLQILLLSFVKAQVFIDSKNLTAQPVPEGKYPWLVSLQDSFGHFCGGTLLDATTVITASHCFPPEYPFSPNMVAYSGVSDLRNLTKAFKFRLKSLTKHPDYFSNSLGISNDIAIIKVEPYYQTNVQPLAVRKVELDNGTYSKDYRHLTTAGWGTTNAANSSYYSPVLSESPVTILPQDVCQNNMYPDLYPTSICGYSLTTGTCQSDAGSPMYVVKPDKSIVLVGINSYSQGCATQNVAGVYSRVSGLSGWVNSVLPMLAPVQTTTAQPTGIQTTSASIATSIMVDSGASTSKSKSGKRK